MPDSSNHARPKLPSGGHAPSRGFPKFETGSFRRWLRTSFTRENVFASLRTFAWVASLTLLIWFWAERDQSIPQQGLSVPVEFHSVDPTHVVTSRLDQGSSVVVDVFGPRIAIERIRETLRKPSDRPVVQIELERNLPLGLNQIDLSQRLSNQPLFKGVSVKSVSPSQVQVYVDVIDEVECEVSTPPEAAGSLVSAIYEPATVKLKGPKRSIEMAGNPPRAYVDVASHMQELSQPGKHQFPALRLKPPTQPGLAWSAPTVQAGLETRQADRTIKLDAVTVWLVPAPGLSDQYRFEYDGSIANVSVKGPPEQIDLIANKSFIPKAWAVFVEGDIKPEGKPHPISLRYELPKGVIPTGDAEQKTVNVTAVKRGD